MHLSPSPRIVLRDGAMHDYCKRQGITRAALAREMGVTEQTAWRVEQGVVDPSPRFIALLMRVTGRKFEHLFEVSDEVAA